MILRIDKPYLSKLELYTNRNKKKYY